MPKDFDPFLFSLMLGCVYCSGSSDRASQPFPIVDTPTGCLSLSRSGI